MTRLVLFRPIDCWCTIFFFWTSGNPQMIASQGSQSGTRRETASRQADSRQRMKRTNDDKRYYCQGWPVTRVCCFTWLTPGWLLGLDPLKLPDRDPQRNQVDAAEPSTCLSSPNLSPYSCFNDIDWTLGLCSGTRWTGQSCVGSREVNSNCWDFEKQKEKTVIRKFVALIPNCARESSRWCPVCIHARLQTSTWWCVGVVGMAHAEAWNWGGKRKHWHWRSNRRIIIAQWLLTTITPGRVYRTYPDYSPDNLTAAEKGRQKRKKRKKKKGR